ncbi:MAG: anion permease [Desulfobacterales bacterium]|nr:anion permease [Desulfobacterales bacterium]MCF8078696.1 anion permease [Desulfobacterales bacterium]
MDTHGEKRGIFAKKGLWIGIGAALFILIAFILPTPESLVEVMEEYGYVDKMIEWEIAHNIEEASQKTMIVLGIVPMAVVFFAVEALPIGVTGLLMPLLAYFFGLLPFNMIGKTFAGDAPLFMLGVFALGATVVEVGFHKRLAVWLLGWTKGFWVPMIVLCISMSMVGSFLSAPAMCSFMVPVLMAVYYGSVEASSTEGKVVHDPALAKFLLFSLCFSLNMGGPGTPSAGGRNVIMMGFFNNYDIPITYYGWMKYGWPLVPIGGAMVLLYMTTLFSKKIKTRDLTPGLEYIKDETRKMGKMTYPEYVTGAMLFLIVLLWIFGGEATGLGGPALLALVVPVLFKTVQFEKILKRISFNAWFMYCGALTLGALLKESGGALWLAKTFLNGLAHVNMDQGYGLWVGMSGFSGFVTNFMSDAATVALIGPIVVPMGIMTGVAGEPWAIGMAVALASSYAHFLVVGSPTNALTFALGVYPDTNKRVLETIDFVKYGFGLFVLSMALLWLLEFLVVYNLVGFPDGILEQATQVLQSAKQ